ncbi:glycosyltransferase family 2 protein, partial [Klebsiella pneumoniae]|nr:glycosyltransferase family 2 protein [Klebsiella pneumoniae]
GSNDGSEAIVRAAAATSSQPIRYENLGTNYGVAATRNRLMELAEGEIFAFLDADDWWTPEHLAAAAACFKAGVGVVVTGVRTF